MEMSYQVNLRNIGDLTSEKFKINLDLAKLSFWEKSKKQKLENLLKEIDITQDKYIAINNQLTDNLINLDFYFLY